MSRQEIADFKKMGVALALIICASVTMHVFIFSKQPRAYRNLPTPTEEETPRDQFVTQGPPVVGKVVALGTERFYLDTTDGKRWTFLFGALEPHPEVGQQLRIYYHQGTPPTALKVEPATN
jgi:hypothetical protein